MMHLFRLEPSFAVLWTRMEGRHLYGDMEINYIWNEGRRGKLGESALYIELMRKCVCSQHIYWVSQCYPSLLYMPVWLTADWFTMLFVIIYRMEVFASTEKNKTKKTPSQSQTQSLFFRRFFHPQHYPATVEKTRSHRGGEFRAFGLSVAPVINWFSPLHIIQGHHCLVK